MLHHYHFDFIEMLLAKPRFSKRERVVGGSFKYSEFLRKDGKFPMTGERDGQSVAHRIKSPMGWGFSGQALNSRMKSFAVKADGTGEAPHFSAEWLTCVKLFIQCHFTPYFCLYLVRCLFKANCLHANL